MRVNTNISSIQAQNSARKVADATEASSSKLSSGQRIRIAADDAAGLAISEKLKAEIRSSRQANRNATDGVSLVQTAEGGLSETSSILTRMRELAMQAASDTVGDKEREFAQMEYEGIKNELERISKTTEFNGRKLLDGTAPKLDFQVGVGDHSIDDQISYDSNQLNSGVKSLGVDSSRIVSKMSAQQSLGQIDSAINKISSQRSVIGSLQNRLVSSSNNLMIYHENMSMANNRIRDLDYAEESANQAKNNILGSSSTAVLAQANVNSQAALKLLA
jgi:flagellin